MLLPISGASQGPRPVPPVAPSPPGLDSAFCGHGPLLTEVSVRSTVWDYSCPVWTCPLLPWGPECRPRCGAAAQKLSLPERWPLSPPQCPWCVAAAGVLPTIYKATGLQLPVPRPCHPHLIEARGLAVLGAACATCLVSLPEDEPFRPGTGPARVCVSCWGRGLCAQ